MRLTTAIKKWGLLSSRQKAYWIRAAWVLTVIGISLKLMSFATFKKWYSRLSSRFPRKPVPDAEVADVVWAVESAARILPFRLLCLPQSLAAKYLLGKSEGVVMHIGVNKDIVKGFEFHAWVEKKGKTIIGDLPTQYQPLWVWD